MFIFIVIAVAKDRVAAQWAILGFGPRNSQNACERERKVVLCGALTVNPPYLLPTLPLRVRGDSPLPTFQLRLISRQLRKA